MCDHKKKATNIHKQTSHVAAWRTHCTHTHTHMHTKKSSPHFTKGRTNLKRPQDFRVEKQKLPLTVVECWPPTLCVCVCACGVSCPRSAYLPFSFPLLLSTSGLAICYLCNVYVWMVNICKYPGHIQPIYMRIYTPHFPFYVIRIELGSIYAAASTPKNLWVILLYPICWAFPSGTTTTTATKTKTTYAIGPNKSD